MNADKNEPDGSFPERTKCTKPRRPRPSAAGKRVSPRPAWLTERPAVRVRKDLAAFFEFFTPLHFCVARPRHPAPARNARPTCYHKNSWRMLRFETAGESHGECLVATLTGLPAGVPASLDTVSHELWRRQQGYGRGGRMKIEPGGAEIVSGVRHSQTIGSPVAILIPNLDWPNSAQALPVENPIEDMDGAEDKRKPVTRPRPGHADLAGAIKYNFADARYVLERASARETTARVAIGAVAKALLIQFGIDLASHVIAVGSVRLERVAAWEEVAAMRGNTGVLLGCVDAATEQRMKEVVDQAYRTGDTAGGVFEVIGHGVPPGLGSHTTWDARLDGRLAQAIVSIQAVKGVELGF